VTRSWRLESDRSNEVVGTNGDQGRDREAKERVLKARLVLSRELEDVELADELVADREWVVMSSARTDDVQTKARRDGQLSGDGKGQGAAMKYA
jgi:hypothetical protein